MKKTKLNDPRYFVFYFLIITVIVALIFLITETLLDIFNGNNEKEENPYLVINTIEDYCYHTYGCDKWQMCLSMTKIEEYKTCNYIIKRYANDSEFCMYNKFNEGNLYEKTREFCKEDD